MEWVNLHHLQYFRVIARAGGLTGAALALRLTHSTLSAQLRALEAALGGALFQRKGRRLVLTPFGEEILVYADNIHRLSAELMDFARGRAAPRQRRPLRVGVIEGLPKSIVGRLLEPALSRDGWGPTEVRERPLKVLVGDLVAGRVHLALSDEPVTRPGIHSQLVASSGLSFYGVETLARKYRPNFPARLAGAPMVLPRPRTALRRTIDRWLTEHNLPVSVEAEIDDAAMLRVFGAQGLGLFPVRNSLRVEVESHHEVEHVGELDGVVEHYYAVSVERPDPDSGILQIIEHAHQLKTRP